MVNCSGTLEVSDPLISHSRKKELFPEAYILKKDQTNLSNRSFEALQIGHIPGGCSRAQRYPQTLQRQTGSGKTGTDVVETILTTRVFPRSDRGGRRSGMGATFCFPVAIASFMYSAQ